MPYGTDCPFRDVECNRVCSLFISTTEGFEGCTLKLIALTLRDLADKYELYGK
jgi:hypothetical protein